jgi:hypothetical protein
MGGYRPAICGQVRTLARERADRLDVATVLAAHATNVHFLTAEHIDVDGDTAKGRWIMLQASGYLDWKAELIAARLEVDFVPATRDQGLSWLIHHFRTERLFDAPWHVNPRNGVTA